MYAAASNRTALDRLSPSENDKYSVFTRTLLPLMGRRDLSIQDLSEALKDHVWKLAKSVGREQRPTYYNGMVGRFCLAGCFTASDQGLGRSNERSISKTPLRPAPENVTPSRSCNVPDPPIACLWRPME